jgi:DNA-binding transcriptional MerR regulator
MAIANRGQREQPALHKAPEAFRTISEVADELDLPQHVLRFWETRFPQIKPMKRGGGRRYYRPDDVGLLRGIRHLLYGEGYTIRGVQRILKDHGAKFVQSVWQAGAPQPQKSAADLNAAEPAIGDEQDETDARVATPQPKKQLPVQGAAELDHPSARIPGAGLAAIREASVSLVRQRSVATDAGRPGKSDARWDGEDVRKLKAVLDDLIECRQLIDAALAEGS